jgi:hypothetical protein
VDRRLRQFLKKGSQSGPRDYWARLTTLFRAIPSEILPSNAADAAELLSALQGGIIKKDEPKYNHEAAFGAYLDIVALINARLPEEDKAKLLTHHNGPSPQTPLPYLPRRWALTVWWPR